jgi:hypothetical protein
MPLFFLSLAYFHPIRVSAQIFPNSHTETHPGSADGLLRIDSEGNYIYKEKIEPSHQSSQIRIGAVSNPNLAVQICDNNGGNCQDISYDDIYTGASGLAVEYDYEYFLFENSLKRIGRFGIQAGVALNIASGHGRLVVNPSQESEEIFTFVTMPLFLGLIYRFEYADRQVFVPYVSGGGVYAVLAEKREDRSKINAIGGAGFYGSGGALLNLSSLDRELGSEFESEYGIVNLWLSLELKLINVSSEAFTIQNGYVQAGMGFDF